MTAWYDEFNSFYDLKPLEIAFNTLNPNNTEVWGFLVCFVLGFLI